MPKSEPLPANDQEFVKQHSFATLFVGSAAAVARTAIVNEELTTQEQREPLLHLLRVLKAFNVELTEKVATSRLLNCREELTWLQQLTS